MTRRRITELIGWAGTILILGGYILLSLGIINDLYIYHSLMLVGSAGIAIISYVRKIWQTFVLNICFMSFALFALIRLSFLS